MVRIGGERERELERMNENIRTDILMHMCDKQIFFYWNYTIFTYRFYINNHFRYNQTDLLDMKTDLHGTFWVQAFPQTWKTAQMHLTSTNEESVSGRERLWLVQSWFSTMKVWSKQEGTCRSLTSERHWEYKAFSAVWCHVRFVTPSCSRVERRLIQREQNPTKEWLKIWQGGFLCRKV